MTIKRRRGAPPNFQYLSGVPLRMFSANFDSLAFKVRSPAQIKDPNSEKIYFPSQTFAAEKVDKVILLTFGDLKIDPEVKTIDVV